ncbi:MAG TPA: hypothetical protein VLE53_06565 [Gemmatimonadaceae bacterium]|nr:hypothetical protein [Gemmatimonadaceae bacterium]
MHWLTRSIVRQALARSAWLALIPLSTACDRGPAAEPAEATEALRVTAEQFQGLRWLEGRWRGAEPGGAPFFESYRFVDDSTIQSYTYADSSFTAASDSGLIRLRGDSVTSGWPVPRYVVTAIATDSVYFAALPGAANDFTWRFVETGHWTARLTWDSAGVARERIYEMRAIP